MSRMRTALPDAIAFLDRSPASWKEGVETAELNRRLLWFLLLRASVIAILLLLGLGKSLLIRGLTIGAPSLLCSAGLLCVMNVLFWLHYRKAAACADIEQGKLMAAMNIQAQIILDFLILGFLVYECGGIESPLVYFFLFHNTLSCLFFPRRISFFHTLLSVAIILAIHLLVRAQAVPETHFIRMGYYPYPGASGPGDFYQLGGIAFMYGVAWYLISTITDSLRERERQLQEKVREMTEVDREKTRYMLVTTHELKAPFAAIQSHINVMLEGYAGEVPEKVREILGKIRARCAILSSMLVEMIQLANLASLKERRAELTTERVDLGRAVEDALARLDEIAREKRVSFDAGAAVPGRHFILANPEQMQILLNNILGNAVAYSRPGTAVAVELRAEDDSVLARVRDRGIGIKKEHLEKVFLEHFREEKAVEVNPNSTGLGLSIARRIMELHKGRIWLESEEGKGTTVWMEFPGYGAQRR